MDANGYLGRSRLFQRLRNGPHGELVERYAGRLVEERRPDKRIWQYLNMVGGLLDWIAEHRLRLTNIDEHAVEQYLRHRGSRQSIQTGDRAALKRWLSVLRDEGAIAPATSAHLTQHEQIFKEFADYLRAECGLAPRSIICHLPTIRRFLHEVCGATDRLDGISQESVIRYIERHARDWSPDTGKRMCWSLRAFLRYLHHQGLHTHGLAGCVPSIRQWKSATLPTYLSAAQIQKALDSCDRLTAVGRRQYAILMLLARLGLRANEVTTLTLDDIDWRAGVLHVHAKGRQRARVPIPPDVGAAIVEYLRSGRQTSSCRRLFVRVNAPYLGLATAASITIIAKNALQRAGITGCAHRGAHIFRHSLATELLRSGATLTEIGQVLQHKSLEATRIYAKVDTETLRTLSLPWPGGSR